MRVFSPISLIQVPLGYKYRLNIHDGMMKAFAISALRILYFKGPLAHSTLFIDLKQALIPNTAPIHPNRDAN